jgi:two-component system sensor histidine kinase KdpD
VSDVVTHVRADDLLDETPPQRLARRFGLTRKRQLIGLVAALIVLPLLTLLLDAASSWLSLDGEVLVYLLGVVALAIAGGVIVGVGSAIAAALLINYFFVEPVHTLDVADGDQAVSLVIFIAVAAAVSGAVEIAVRRARAAERARFEAETMSALAGPRLDEGEESVREIVRRARETFAMESVTLKARVRGTGEWIDVEHSGWAPAGEESQLRFDVPAGPDIRLVGRGPALFAEDQRVLEAFAAAARTAYEGRQLSGRAAEADVLADVDRQRTALLGAVGHDLRTPLAAIKAAVGTLLQTDVEWSATERSDLLDTIDEATDRLDAVVRNLLDASRLEAGALTVHADSVALDEVVSAAALAVPEASGRLRIDVPDDLPLVAGDRGLLQRVLVNVLENAFRHGASEDAVDIRAVAGGGSARLEVVDHGQGVPAGDEAEIFEPFRRLDEREGVGLGLAVARGFVEAMGGAMVADGTDGGGLTMRIRLPLASAPDPVASGR